MTMYDPLRISKGGGIIDHNKQSERQDGATLIIGLGGTGGKAVQQIKKALHQDVWNR